MDETREIVPTGRRSRMDGAGNRLVGGRCLVCSTATWPARSVCYRCGSDDIEFYQLPPIGTLETWTRVWVPIEGIEPPYEVGFVNLCGVRIFMHLRGIPEEITVGSRVKIVIDPEASPPFWAEPLPDGVM